MLVATLHTLYARRAVQRPDPDAPASSSQSTQLALLCGLGAYLWWGFIPAYFHYLNVVAPTLSPWLMLGHRIIWSTLVLSITLIAQRRLGEVRVLLKQKRTLALLVASTFAIAVNWFVFMWAVAQHRLTEASLGYYINPLMNVALGMIFLRERLRRWQIAALALAGTGVLMLTIHRGQAPWVSLALAVSFGFYGLLRKLAPVGPVLGLLVEVVILLPAGIFLVGNAAVTGTHPPGAHILVLLSLLGITTCIPLLMFAFAARRLRLSTLGFLQYVGPTCQFLLAVLAFGEPFGRAEILTFTCIWVALAIYSVDSCRAYHNDTRATYANPGKQPESLLDV